MSKASSSRKAAGKESPQKTALPPVAGGVPASPLLHLLLLALVALVAYSNTFHVPFVFDDNSSIVDNPMVKDLSTFLAGAGYAYNPRRFIGYLSFALNYRLGGLDVTGYHIFNLAIHIFTAWLVYIFVRLTLRTPYFAKWSAECGVRSAESKSLYIPNSEFRIPNSLLPLFAALLFVTHPVQTQAVTYIVQRLASLATLFYLASIVFYIKARLASGDSEALGTQNSLGPQSGSKLKTQNLKYLSFFALSLISAILAMRTKEIAATLPLVVVLYEFSFFGANGRRKLLFLVPLLLTLLIIPIGMFHAGKPLGELLSDVNEITRESRAISRGDYLLTQFSIIVTYIRLLIFPVNQNLDYDYPLYDSLFTPRVFFSFLFLLALFGLAIYLYFRSTFESRGASTNHQSPITIHHSRLIAFGILWFFITLSVESSVIPISDVIFEHRLYLPSVGAFIALAALAALVFRSRSHRSFVTASAIIVLLLTVATWRRNLVWGDNLALWSDVTRKSPRKAKPHNNLGTVLVSQGRLDGAIEHFQTALRLSPDYAHAHNNLGDAYGKKGLTDKAINKYQVAIKLQPDFAEAHSNLGTAYLKKGFADRAIEEFRTALKIKPEDGDTHFNLGAAYETKGWADKAIEEYRLVVMLQPGDREALSRLEVISGKMEFRREVPISTGASADDATAHYRKANDLINSGRLDEGIEEYKTAIRLKHDFAEAHNNLGVAYGMKKYADKAIVHLQTAVRLRPDDLESHINLARAYEMKGLTGRAEEERQLAAKIGKR